jgi:hypothetical protein
MDEGKCAKASQVSAAIGTQEKVVSDLQETVSRLAGRLETVLRNDVPTAGGGIDKNPTELVPCAQAINRNTVTVQGALSTIRSILDRCEL